MCSFKHQIKRFLLIRSWGSTVSWICSETLRQGFVTAAQVTVLKTAIAS